MSTHDNTSTADTSGNWRKDPPPHMAELLPSGDASTFLSAASQPSAPTENRATSPGSEAPASNMDRTSSPEAASGLTAYVAVDSHGQRYLRETGTGLRIDFSNIEAEKLATGPLPASDTKDSTSLSDVSDVTPGTTDSPPSDAAPEEIIDAMLNGLDPKRLSDAQKALIHSFKGSMSTSRSRLLNTTAVVLDQRKTAQTTRDSLAQFREETSERFHAFAEALDADHAVLEDTIKENLRLLLELGETESNINRLLGQMGATGVKTIFPRPILAPISNPATTAVDARLAAEIDKALPPRRDYESDAEFARRAQSSAAIPKVTRFESMESISSAPRYRQQAAESMSAVGGPGIGPALTRMDFSPSVGTSPADLLVEFNEEADKVIRALITRQVGASLDDLPSRLRAPKLEPPPKYGGENDHVKFMAWLELVCTWMRASFMGGPGTADNYRITVLKTLLNGSALQWFSDYVETRSGMSLIPYEFESVICALHRRFITAATAQKASREFDAVRYNAENGPLKLMDELIDCSGRLREPMPDFIIRQRFMRLLPDAISGTMSLHRALSAEYSDIAQLRAHSHQIWDYFNTEKRRARLGAAPTATTANATQTPRPVTTVKRDNPRPPTTGLPGHMTTGAGGNSHGSPTSDNPHAHKRCYRCGNLGHLGNDKNCPKNLVDRPRVAAQRVPDSYAEDDYVVVEDVPEDQHPVTDNWGGSQYDPDYPSPEDRDPNEAPDLADLLALEDGLEARVGAMRLQTFSLHIEPTVSAEQQAILNSIVPWTSLLSPTQTLLNDLDDELSVNVTLRSLDDIYGPSALIDLSRLKYARELNGSPAMDDSEIANIHLALVREHDYPITSHVSADELQYEYQARHGYPPYSGPWAVEWTILTLLVEAEQVRTMSTAALELPTPDDALVSLRSLAQPMDDLNADVARFSRDVALALAAQKALGDAERAGLEIFRRLPAEYTPGIDDRTLDIRELVVDLVNVCCDEVERANTSLGVRVVRLQALQAVLEDEIRRRRGIEGKLRPPTLGQSDEEAGPHSASASPELAVPGYLPLDEDGPVAIRAHRVLGFHELEDRTRDEMRAIYGPGVISDSESDDDTSNTNLRWTLGEQTSSESPDTEPESDPDQRAKNLSDSDPTTSEESLWTDSDEYQLVDASRADIEPGDADELIIRSIGMALGTDTADLHLTYKDHNGHLYVKTLPLPDTHYLSPALRNAHKAAMETAIIEHAAASGISEARASVEEVCDFDPSDDLPRLPRDHPYILELELEHPLSKRLKPLPKASVEEVCDFDPSDDLPRLPLDHPYILELDPEHDKRRTRPRPPRPSVMEETDEDDHPRLPTLPWDSPWDRQFPI
ncbi:hypothetical protein B0H15DRAFT_801549 [Mycena belliarum]|uniref:CCHC-type domain-containing protein n=1 Tax=Mycena belliarum TaxID=1033014 RepID=A0AAD6U474_9AGAR|nr:hypothetical protein B0H15DRAFT_801549 [Mycena belliae]